MKRSVSILIILAALLLMAACGTSVSTKTASRSDAPQQEASIQAQSEPAAESSVVPDTHPEVTASQAVQSTQEQVSTTGITEEEAKRIALEDAGVTESELSGIYIHLDWDDGIQEYDVEFYVDGREYDYEISAQDGTIRSRDSEMEYISSRKKESGTTEAAFSEADAIALVLEKVPGATKDLVRIHLDRDDGVLIYEGSLVFDGIEYDFEIHGETGAVLEWEAEKEHWD